MAVELAFAAVSLAAAVVLTFSLGPAADATNQTTVRVVGAALFALACGAVLAARDPAGSRAVVWIEIVFTAVSAADLVTKIVVDSFGQARTWLLLAAVVCGLVCLLWVEPSTRTRPLSEADRDRVQS